jgi:enediyne polyketide synthase
MTQNIVPSTSNSEFINFVEAVLTQQREVETIARCFLSHATHPYLLDHNYKGAMIMPTVFGLEAMAQVALITLPNEMHSQVKDLVNHGWVIENIQLSRPIPVGAKGVDIEIYAEVQESKPGSQHLRVHCGIRCASTGYAYDHFYAEFVFADQKPQTGQPLPLSRSRDNGLYLSQDLGIKPMDRLYGSILFQGSRFQRIQSIYFLESDNENHGKTVLRATQSQELQTTYLLGDPYFRDALLQSAQLIIPQNQCLPVEIGRIEILPGYKQRIPKFILTEVHKADAKSYLATIEVTDEQGNLLQKLDRYRLQFLEKQLHLPKAMDLIPAISASSHVLGNIAATQPIPSTAPHKLLEPYKVPASLLRIDAVPGGPQDQSVFIHRFIPDFKTFANLGSGVYFSHIFNWMGQSREMSSIPVLNEIRTLTESGKWGQVTNWANIEVLGECRNHHRIVEARMWCGKLGGSKMSAATLSFDWLSVGENGVEERIARGQMGFTWVEILTHGVVQPAPLPQAYFDFIKTMEAQNEQPNVYASAHEPLRSLSPGRSLLKTTGGPRSVVPLATKTFETSTFDSNLVGNIYFGNYSIWMGRVRDTYFYKLAPVFFTKSKDICELICTKSRIQHLREAMPFDDIVVTMGLVQLSQAGIDLQFEFFRKNPTGVLEKLAIADHQCVWTHKAADGTITAHEWPEEIRTAILNAHKTKYEGTSLNAS